MTESALQLEVERFRKWAGTLPSKRSGEWECDYGHWDDLYTAGRQALSLSPERWSAETRTHLLYAIARDNEVGILVRELSDVQLRELAGEAILFGEWEAKWQFASRLGELTYSVASEQLLLRLVNDPVECVRRMALLALAEIGSAHTELLAVRSWDSGHEYQRIASLHALQRVRSPLLSKHLELAKGDGRPHVLKRADDIQNRQGEYATK